MRKPLTGLCAALAAGGVVIALAPAAAGAGSTAKVVFTQAPNTTTTATSATFNWQASDTANSSATFTYKCALTPPGQPPPAATACAKPKSYSGLTAGVWSFTVTATETGSLQTASATWTWDVALPPAPKPGIGLGAAAPNGSTVVVYDLNRSNAMEYAQRATGGTWSPANSMYSGSPASGPGATTLNGAAWVYATTTSSTMVSWQSGTGYHFYTRYLGTTLTARPGTAVAAANRIDLFARGLNGALLHSYYTPSTNTISTWQAMNFTLPAGSGPSAVGIGANSIAVVARGTDNAVYLFVTKNLGSTWSRSKLGGATYSDPTITDPAAGVVDVFVRGTNNHLFQDEYASGRWSGWTDRGGLISDSPAATANVHGIPTTVFALGSNNLIYQWTRATGWTRGP